MLDKKNRMQWRKLMHRTNTFTGASSHQRIHPASKVIVGPILCFSSCPVHRSLFHVWQIIPEYYKKFPIDPYLHKFRILVPSIYALFWTSNTHPQLIQICIFHDRCIYGVYFFITIPFLSPPFFCMDRWCLQMMGFFNFWYVPKYISCTYWLITSLCIMQQVNINQNPWIICPFLENTWDTNSNPPLRML